MSSASDLLISGNFLGSLQVALESGLGSFVYILILSACIIAIYIKTNSLPIVGFGGFLGILAFSYLFNIFTQPLIFVVVILFIALIIFDIFVKGGKK